MGTQFLVDLGSVQLTKEQIKAVDDAIQKAVGDEIAKFNLKDKIAFVPLEKSRGLLDETLKIGNIHYGITPVSKPKEI